METQIKVVPDNKKKGTDIQKITPFLWFDSQAEEAVSFYTSIFKNSKIKIVTRYGAEGAKAAGRQKGTVMTIAFEIEGQEFVVINDGPVFEITPAISFVVNCATQEEIDFFWGKLSEGGDERAQQCGWLQDKYGVSWQIVPAGWGEMMEDTEKSEIAMREVLQMKKIDISIIKRAYEQR